jgi:hypothetical protein
VMTDNVSLNFERFWNGIGLGFSFLSFPLCFSLLSSRTRTRPKETETGRNDHRLEEFLFWDRFLLYSRV